jgi:hypothetical protein
LTIVQEGVVRINPDITHQGLTPEPDYSWKPMETQFHRNWKVLRDDPFNSAHPNWLPPVPDGLKGSDLNAYMIANDDVYPTLKISSADTLYHFTTDEGADCMSTSRKVYPSVVARDADRPLWRGVYLSS